MVSRLRSERVLRGWTVYDVKAAIRVPISRVSVLERGLDTPREHEKEKFSKLFGVPAEELFPSRAPWREAMEGA